jgi:hypothetical protein
MIKSQFLKASNLFRPDSARETGNPAGGLCSAELWATPPPLNTYEGGRIFCLDLFVKGQFICDVQ